MDKLDFLSFAVAMVRSFFIILTGVVVSNYLFFLLFYPEATFSAARLGDMLTFALLTDLPLLVFYSRKEPSKENLFARRVIHFVLLACILIFRALALDWIDFSSPAEVAFYAGTYILIYALFSLAYHLRDKRTAAKLNDGLKRRYGTGGR